MVGWGKDDAGSAEVAPEEGEVYWVDLDPEERLQFLLEVEVPVESEPGILFHAAESLEVGNEEERDRAWTILRESSWPDDVAFWNNLLYGSGYLAEEDKSILFTRTVEELSKRPEEDRDADWFWFMSYGLMGKGLGLPRGEALEAFSQSLDATHEAARLFQESGHRQMKKAAWRQVAFLEEMFGSLYFSYEKAIAEEHYQRFLETMKKLVEFGDNPEDEERLRVARLKWADTLRHVGEAEKALGLYQLVEDELMVAMDGAFDRWTATILSISWQTVAQSHLVDLEFEEALRFMEKARRWQPYLMDVSIADFPSSFMLSFYAAEEALARFMIDDADGLEEHFERVEKLLHEYGSASERQNWQGIRNSFTQIGEELVSNQAEIALREARRVQIRGNLMRHLAHDIHHYGQSPAAALAAQNKAATLLHKYIDDAAVQEDALFAWGHLGHMYLKSEWWEHAEEVLTIFDRASRQELAGFEQDVEFRLLRANALLDLAEVRHFLTQDDSQDELIEEALALFNALGREGFLRDEGWSTLQSLRRGEWRPSLRDEWAANADALGRSTVSEILEGILQNVSISVSR